MRQRTGLRRQAAASILVLAFALACGAPAFAQARFDFEHTPGNLPKDVVPSRYALSFDLDPARDEFSARASITITVRKPVAAIVVHAHELKALDVTLADAGGTRRLAVAPDAKTQTWRLAPRSAAPIAPGRYVLALRYAGVVHRTGQGLYRAEYRAHGKPARLLATQLQAIFARSLFPCFDEPAFRAVFDIAVRAPTGYEVVSNMPQASQAPDHGAVLHRFRPTPPMPTYLVAVAVGRFAALRGEAAGVPLRILSAAGRRDAARYAMTVMRRVLPFYVKYFGTPYALPKLDLLAVPSTRSGAMEDWGLISYAENLLLYDPARSGPRAQRRVFSVVAHEVAHQWFGDLVTAASWDEIWLNEAFATWMADKVTATFNPGWHADLRQRLPIDRAMSRDAGPATRAIRSGPVPESRVFDVFDDITYLKGGAVLSMLEQWVGPDAFRSGLAAYLEGQKYGNATAGDLWHYISAASGRDVARVAASWTDQEGLPAVRVDAACVDGKTRVRLAQERFTTSPAERTGRTWRIPVRLRRGAALSTVMLERPEQTIDLDGCGDEPIVVNAGGRGFYRVQYGEAQLAALTRRFARLAPADRVTLLSDTFALAQAGRVPVARYFDLLAETPRARGADRTVLLTLAAAGLDSLDAALAGTPAQARVREAGRRLFAPELARLGWTPRARDAADALRLRGALIAQLARFDDAQTIAHAQRLFDRDAAGAARLPASIRAAVIEAVGRHADRAHFERLISQLKTAAGEEDRWTYAHALAVGRDAGRAREVLALALGGEVGPNIAVWIPGMVGEESPFGELAYDFTLANWERLAVLAGDMFGARAWLLPQAASGFNDDAAAARLIADQRAKAGADGAAPAATVAARIALRAAVKRRDAERIAALLENWRPRR